MALETSEVFTPAKLPTFTDVTRSEVSASLNKLLRRGGFFISVSGTTKLGKTTLVRGALKKLDYSIYMNGSALADGPYTLWHRLASELGIPSVKERGTVSGDKSTWKFYAKFSAMFPGFGGAEAGSEAGGEHSLENQNSSSVPLDAEGEVTKAFKELVLARKKIAIVIDDFHFVTDVNTRRELIQGLRGLAIEGVSIVMITLPGRSSDAAFAGTQTGGRHKPVEVPVWSSDDLMKIAYKGFSTLNLSADEALVKRLAKESFGSPQIMQQLCLDLCEDVNGVYEEVAGNESFKLSEPQDWTVFFKGMEDSDSASVVSGLVLGPKKRRHARKKHSVGDREMDGYQLFLWALRELDVPMSIPFQVVKSQVATMLGLDATQINQLALEQKVRNMHLLAHKAMNDHVEGLRTNDDDVNVEDASFSADELALASDIPQPVFEYTNSASTPMVSILDPLLAYTLKWHEESFLGVVRSQSAPSL